MRALSPRINVLNYFIDKVDVGPGLGVDFNNLDEEALEELKGPLAMELMKFLESSSRASAKTAESLDMLEKGQIRLNTGFNFEQRGLESVSKMVEYAIQALMIIALFLGSCMLCTVPPNAMEGTSLPAVFPIMGFIGYVVSLWLTYFLYRSMKKDR